METFANGYLKDARLVPIQSGWERVRLPTIFLLLASEAVAEHDADRARPSQHLPLVGQFGIH
jgi:hypothetical protein